MRRRKFLQTVIATGLTLTPFGKWLLAGIQKIRQSKKISISGKIYELDAWNYSGVEYISANQLALALNLRTYFNDDKKKLVLYFPQNRVVFTAKNAFVMVDKELYQLPYPVIWDNDEILVPYLRTMNLLNRKTTFNFQVDANSNRISVEKRDVNITAVEIDEKQNGNVIRFYTTKAYQTSEVTADMRYGWLHVDFYGGKADTTLIQSTSVKGMVRRIRTFQFPELASIAFLLKGNPQNIEVVPKPERNEVLVILQTAKDLSESEKQELREEEDKIPDDLKKQLEEERKKWLIDTVVIDPGHGGKDPGAVGYNKLYEKNVVLPIALQLGTIIKKEMPGVKVVYTREEDRFISLRRRTQIANENNGKVFISIHANSNSKKRVSGFETYILGPEKGDRAKEVVLKENSVINFEDSSSRQSYTGINQILATMAQNAFSRQSEYLAELVQQNLHKEFRTLKLPNRGVKQGPFWVMVGASMPNILVETGFISNPYDAKILKTAVYQHKIARGIFNGLKQFKHDYENAI
ncbi:MAG: hypothetical protein Kow0037_16980 [Calditrichia bacterium]